MTFNLFYDIIYIILTIFKFYRKFTQNRVLDCKIINHTNKGKTNMKDRTAACIYYTNAHGICEKGFKDVTLKTCKNCSKYKPRKTNHKPESVASKRRKDTDRHDNWKTRY